MFSFHKPKVYRSAKGCCICCAKSSSSRFTDSKKYEVDSMKCFNLKKPRHGEICNACVLLVKRYKRLPTGNNRHWGHVVDARAGPGTKYLIKNKKGKSTGINDETSQNNSNNSSLISKKFFKIFKKKDKNSTGINETTTAAVLDSDDHNNITLEPTISIQKVTMKSSIEDRHLTKDNEEICRHSPIEVVGSKRRKSFTPIKNRRVDEIEFFEDTDWKRRKTCFGAVYECPEWPGVAIIDLNRYKHCTIHQKYERTTVNYCEMEQIPLIESEEPIKSIKQLQLPLPILPAQDSVEQSKQLIQKKLTTVPEVVHLVPPSREITSVNAVKTIQNKIVSVNPIIINHTPALKKHHLYFKRQSQQFPTVDFSLLNDINKKTDATIKTKTKTTMPLAITFKTDALPTEAASMAKNPIVNVQKISSSPPIISETVSQIITQKLNKPSTTSLSLTLPPVRFKTLVNEMEQSYVLSSKSQINATVPNQQQIILAAVNFPTDSESPNSVSNNSSNKFSDNSSDSGFDENMQDRKSASPLQEETEKKILHHSGVHTMFLTSGVQVQAQQQNSFLTGNEVACKYPNNCQYQYGTSTKCHNLHQTNYRCKNNNNNNSNSVMKTDNCTEHTKNQHVDIEQEALYNNSTIKNENGVTTILPGFTLTATNQQTATINPTSPSYVTITPKFTATTTAAACRNGKYHQNVTVDSCGKTMKTNSGAREETIEVTNKSNQKIILLKTMKTNNTSSSNNLTERSTRNLPLVMTAKHHNQ